MVGRIPQTFIDELMARVDIVEIIDARVPLRKTGRDHMARCPFHEEKTPSFTVSQSKQFYHCFGCGAHGTAIGFLMEYEHMGFVETVHALAGQAGLEVPEQDSATTTPSRDNKGLYGVLEWAADFYRRQLRKHPGSQRAVDYLRARSLSGEIAADYGIGFAPPGWDNLLAMAVGDEALKTQLTEAGLLVEKTDGGYYDRFRDRIMFPIHDSRGRTIGFGGRVLGDDTPKYMNSPETPLFHKGQELYGFYQARKAQRNLERLLVVEGYMDVVALAQHGIRYAVATLGTATTPTHLERLFRAVPEVVFCFDGDAPGRNAAWRALENALPIMREGRQAGFLFLPEGEDPDSLVRQEGQARFEARIVQAVPLSSFFYAHMLEQVKINSVDGRARLVELVRPLLSKFPVGVFRRMMIIRLAEIVRMDEKVVTELLASPNARPIAASKERRTRPRKVLGVPKPISPIRLAIALLLQQPSLAQQAGDPQRLVGIEIPGVDLLVSLLELLQSQPHLSESALLERWRGLEEGRYLLKLATWQPPLGEEDKLTDEFKGALERLEAQGIEQRRQDLIDKLLGQN